MESNIWVSTTKKVTRKAKTMVKNNNIRMSRILVQIIPSYLK